MAKPSVIIAQYTDGVITREQAADALRTADWDTSYVQASMKPGGDYDGGTFEPESFADEVYMPTMLGQLNEQDYDAFSQAFADWQKGRVA